jgi:dCTP deaminase
MPLSASQIAKRLWDGVSPIGDDNTLCVVPLLNLDYLLDKNASSVDLRLGRWFRSMAQTRVTEIAAGRKDNDASISKEHYIRFGDKFVLHPGQFVIGNTLEWLRLPFDLAAYVSGKSSWGRRGLIIETAAGIHPGFTGCLTLELANVGSAPIVLNPGMPICQVFFHEVKLESKGAVTQFVGYRKPALGSIPIDEISAALGREYFF